MACLPETRARAGRWLFRAAVGIGFLAGRVAPAAEPLPADCMPLSEIRVGMVGEARSVVAGFEPAVYKLEILGVEHGGLPGSAMILARLEGPSLEKHGIVAGMSGSPAYINGKCIGAVAYGWTFSYNPLAGITPIESMMTVWDDLDHPEAPAKGKRAPSGLTAPASAGQAAGSGGGQGFSAGSPGRAWEWEPAFEAYVNPKPRDGAQARAGVVSLTPTSPRVMEAMGSAPVEMIPLSAPVCISGASKQTTDLMNRFLGSRGIEMYAAGSSGGSVETPAEASPPMVGGSAIAIPLMTGDLTMASVGTVTYRNGSKLLAFGHPMFFEGKSDAPMASAYTFGYMQSYNRSFKLSEAREIVGSIRQDRQFCIGGVFGVAPERVAVEVNIGGGATVNPRSFKFSAWENEQFSPMLVGTAMMESFLAASSDAGELTAKCDYTITAASGDRVSKTMVASSRGGVAMDFLMGLVQDMFLLEGNPFEQVDLSSVKVDIDVQPGYSEQTILKANPRVTVAQPGETVEVNLGWLPFRGEPLDQRISFKIPEGLREGTYVVHLADAPTAKRIDQRREPGLFAPRTVEEVVGLVKRLAYPDNKLTVFLIEPELGLGVYGAGLEGVPDSIAGTLAVTIPPEAQSQVVGRVVSRESLDYDHPVSGAATFTIDVKHYISN